MQKLMRLIALVMALAFTCNATAQALPSNAYGKAVGRLITNKNLNRGFAANDPRMVATTTATGAVAAGLGYAGAALVVGASSPGWVPVVVGAVITSVVGTALALAADKAIEWIWGEDGKTITIPAGGPATPTVADGPYYTRSASNGKTVQGADIAAVIGAQLAIENGLQSVYQYIVKSCSGSGSTAVCSYIRKTLSNGSTTEGTLQANYSPSGAPGGCAGVFIAGICEPATNPLPDTGDIDIMKRKLSPEDLARPVSPETLASGANELWRRAALQPGYQGLPYDPMNPITPEEADALRRNDPANYPKVADGLAPVPSPANNPIPSPLNVPTTQTGTTALPNGTTTTTTTTTPSAEGVPATTTTTTTTTINNNIDLGPDPGIGAPTLEDAASVESILAPILGMFPDLKGWQVPAHNSECPIYSVDFGAYGVQNIDSICYGLDRNRDIIGFIMLMLWGWIAFRTFMK